MRLQDAFEFCLNSRKKSESGSGAGLHWSITSARHLHSYSYSHRGKRHRRHQVRKAIKGKEPSKDNSDMALDEPFEGIDKVLAAAGFPSSATPARRGALTHDLFAGPLIRGSPTEPISVDQQEAGPSAGGVFLGLPLDPPKMAKRNSKDRIPASSVDTSGVPLKSLPYPFSKPGAGQVSSKDSVPFPATSQVAGKMGSKKSNSSKDSKSKSSSSDQTSLEETSSRSRSGTGSAEQEDEDDDDDEDDDEDEDEFDGSEEPSSGRGSESMSSLGQPISPQRLPFSLRRPGGPGHSRNISSGMSSGQGPSSGSHGHSHSMSSSFGAHSAGGISQSTGNRESTDSESPVRQRASLSQGSNVASRTGIPMPPRHPYPQGQGRGRVMLSTSSSNSSAAAAAALATLNIYPTQPVTFPCAQLMRTESGPGKAGQPVVSNVRNIASDTEAQQEFDQSDAEEQEEEEDDDDEKGEHDDHVGLLVPSPLSGSRSSLSCSSSAHEARSRTHSRHSSRSRHSSTRARTHSSSIRERANSVGTSVRSFARASLTQLDAIMRGATGPAAGLGRGPRSRVNSSMARLEEDVVFPPSVTEMVEGVQGLSIVNSSGSGGSNGFHENFPVDLQTTVPGGEGEAEGYLSYGTDSRSGSESMIAENHTFGRSVNLEQGEDVNEIFLMERSARDTAHNSAYNSERESPSHIVPTVMRVNDDERRQEEPQSFSSASYYSPQYSMRSDSFARTPPTQRRSSSGSNTPEHLAERQGIDIPGRQRQHPILHAHLRARPPRQIVGENGTASTGSLPGISTAAGSFVTAPVSMEGTMTESTSDLQTLSSSWSNPTPAIGMRLRGMGGMVERPGEDMGAGASAWRIV